MTRDEALVRAALEAAALQVDIMTIGNKELTGCIRAIDPAAIIASVGPDPETERLVHATMGLYESAKAVLERYDEFRDEDPARNTVPAMENLRVALAAKQEPDPRDTEIERLRASLACHQSALIAEQELAEQQQERIAELEALLRETAGERSRGRWSTDFRQKVYDAIGKRYIKYE
jgi:hypothetical protein